MTKITIVVTSAMKLTISRRVAKLISIGSPFYQQPDYWISGSPYVVHMFELSPIRGVQVFFKFEFYHIRKEKGSVYYKNYCF